MTAARQELAVPFEDYLDAERDATARHEWADGAVYAMAGGTRRHVLMATLLTLRLAPGALQQGCRPSSADQLLRVGDAAYYPDFMVACGRQDHPVLETDATLVVEVRSPGRARTDRVEKAAAYLELTSLRQCLLLDPDRRRVEVGIPAGSAWHWTVAGPGETVATAYGQLVVDELYDALDAAVPPA